MSFGLAAAQFSAGEAKRRRLPYPVNESHCCTRCRNRRGKAPLESFLVRRAIVFFPLSFFLNARSS